MRMIPRSQRPLSHGKRLTWLRWIIWKVVGGWCKVQQKDANGVCFFFLISVELFRYHRYLSLPGSVEPCRGVIVLSDCAELHSSGKMDGKGSWSSLNGGTMRAGVRKLDYCPPRPSFSRQFRWMKLLNKRSLLFIINLLSSQVFASAEKELRPWISFCARRVALYLHMNWKFALFSFSSLINWSD